MTINATETMQMILSPIGRQTALGQKISQEVQVSFCKSCQKSFIGDAHACGENEEEAIERALEKNELDELDKFILDICEELGWAE